MDITQDELTALLKTVGEATREVLDERLEPVEKRLGDLETTYKSTNEALNKIVGARKSIDPDTDPAPVDDQRDAWGRRRNRT